MLRLFFALQPAAEDSANLAATTAPLIAQLQGQSVPMGNFHATLCFVGAVTPERLPQLREAAATVRGRPATLRFDALEHWATPQILCATAALADATAAGTLAQRLAIAVVAAGFTPDLKPFRSHVTLARKVSAANAEKFSWPMKLEPALVVHCDHFVLMESRRDLSGSIYSAVDSWLLDD